MELTTAEAAKRLGISKARIQQLITDGRLKTRRFGTLHVIKSEDVDGLVVRVHGRPSKAILQIRAIAERPGNDRDAEIARQMLRQHIEERRW